ncbi:MAG: DUF6340 family protein [Dysgonamonadaceae bacterium]|jgi:phage tail tube protein FII|nr:DUF6340 family protein [Dysgonamonadaceae bacterium]
MKNSLFFICILLLTSCSSVYQFTIEVQEPAQITLPPDIVNVLVVNNATPQPGNLGINRMYMGTEITGMELNLDSLAHIATTSLAAHLKESAFFDRVLVSPVSLRSDKNWMGSEPLSDAFKTETFETHGFDGIISINRLMIKLDQEVRKNSYMELAINSITTCAIYLYNKETPLTTFSVADSLSFSAPALGDTIDIFKYFPEYTIHDMAYTIGERLSQRIIPSWTEKVRFLYAGSQSRMTEALSFARKNHWSYAANLWIDRYAHVSQAEAKGKIAANLAVAYEMMDQLDTALQWATTAQKHLRKSGLPDASAENTRIDAHVNDLQKRIRDNDLLDLQWGM